MMELVELVKFQMMELELECQLECQVQFQMVELLQFQMMELQFQMMELEFQLVELVELQLMELLMEVMVVQLQLRRKTRRTKKARLMTTITVAGRTRSTRKTPGCAHAFVLNVKVNLLGVMSETFEI